jgi:hypothetical protein
MGESTIIGGEREKIDIDRTNMKQVEYVISTYPRFMGAYWCVCIEDLNERGRDDLQPEDKGNLKEITRIAQEVFDEWNISKRPIPPPKFTKYHVFDCDYGYPTYHRIKIWV